MFDSKKWLILFFVLALIGSIGGSLVAFLILEKKHKTAEHAAVPVQPVAPEPVTPSPAVKEEVKEAKVEAPAEEDIKPDFQIISRAEWKAKPAASPMKPHTPSSISLHHT